MQGYGILSPAHKYHPLIKDKKMSKNFKKTFICKIIFCALYTPEK